MPLHVMLRRLLTRQRCLDRPAEQIRGQCGLGLNGKFFLRAEGAAACRELDLDVGFRNVENARDGLLIEDRSLTLAVYLDSPGLGCVAGLCCAARTLRVRDIDRIGQTR